MSMDESAWHSAPNPWSVYTRFTLVLISLAFGLEIGSESILYWQYWPRFTLGMD